jgi:hypothetical protein
MKSDDRIYRNTPELYARYMRANPLYFEGLFRMPVNERNIERAVEMMFPGWKAPAAIGKKIRSGQLRRWRKHKAGPNVQEMAPVGPDRGATETGTVRLMTGGEVDRISFDRLRRMIEKIESLGYQVTLSLSIAVETRP